jgi:hypothetical protein
MYVPRGCVVWEADGISSTLVAERGVDPIAPLLEQADARRVLSGHPSTHEAPRR